MASLSLIIRIVLFVGLGWLLTAFVGPLIAAIVAIVFIALEYGRKRSHGPTAFMVGGFALGILWFTLTNLSEIVVIGRG